jgi:hypothetical protein
LCCSPSFKGKGKSGVKAVGRTIFAIRRFWRALEPYEWASLKNRKKLKKPRKIVNYTIKKVKELSLAQLFLPYVSKKIGELASFYFSESSSAFFAASVAVLIHSLAFSLTASLKPHPTAMAIPTPAPTAMPYAKAVANMYRIVTSMPIASRAITNTTKYRISLKPKVIMPMNSIFASLPNVLKKSAK